MISVVGPLDLLLIFRPKNLILSSLSKTGVFQVNWLGGSGIWLAEQSFKSGLWHLLVFQMSLISHLTEFK